MLPPEPLKETPYCWDEEIVPALVMDQLVPAAPSMASAPLAVAFTLPALVIVTGLFFAAKVRGPVVAVLIVRPPLTLTVNVSVAAAELGRLSRLASPNGVAGVAQRRGWREAPGAAGDHRGSHACAVDADADGVAADAGSGNHRLCGGCVGAAAGRVLIVGAAGVAIATLTVNVSVAAVEDVPPVAACVAEIVWLALLKGLVGV